MSTPNQPLDASTSSVARAMDSPSTTAPAPAPLSVSLSLNPADTLTPPPPSATALSAAGANRPAGGTARASGTKTPRKVQWAADTQQTLTAQPSSSSIHELDEHGLDPAAFQSLTHALEQHRFTSVSPNPLSHNANGGYFNSNHHAHAHAHAHHHSHSHAHHAHHHHAIPPLPPLHIASPSSTSISAASTPGGSSPQYDVPGENFIDRDERAGLPGRNAERYSQSRAAKFVSAHKSGAFGFGALKFGAQGRRKHRRGRSRSQEQQQQQQQYQGASDVEAGAETPTAAPRRPLGSGVLSALLTLYDNPHADANSEASSPVRRSFEDRERERDRGRSRERPTFSRAFSFETLGRSFASPSLGSLASTARSPGGGGGPEGGGGGGGGRGGGSGSSIYRGFGLGDSRPAQTRSAAGVFGPLIASTGNIAGVAAPLATTIAPNVKRPGYHLSRYSLESNMPSRARTPAKALPRPRSMHFETLAQAQAAGMDSQPSSLETASAGTATPLMGHHHAGGGGGSSVFSIATGRQKWTDVLKDLPKRGWTASRAGTPSTPGTETEAEDYWSEKMDERKRERKRKRKKAEIYITRHVAEIIQRQEFILKLARAMMMFGGPTHRLQAQMQSTARVLDIELSCMYLPDVMLISFDDAATSTSNIKFIRQSSALDIGKLQEAHKLYWKVIHDDISVKDASAALDELMRRKPLYNVWQIIFFGGMASASICSVSFKGSFIDCLAAFPLGALLVSIQLLSVRNELYSNVFEITVATLLSFLSAALASTHHFCYSAVASSSVVLILPGFIVLCGSLELSSRNIVSGAVRLCFACVYSLFLGFGLAIGAEVYQKITKKSIVGPEDYNCVQSHSSDLWYQSTPSLWWTFLTVPMFSLFLSLRNQAPWNRKELFMLVVISCIGWVTNHFTGTKFSGQNDISAAVGAFAVGVVANVYGRLFRGNAFVVMITGILFQLPSGLGNGGLLTFASQQTSGVSTSYVSGFQTALQLISVSIGLTVGLGISLVLVHPIQSRRRRGGVFSL